MKNTLFFPVIVLLLIHSSNVLANKVENFNLQMAQDVPSLQDLGLHDKPSFSEDFNTNWVKNNFRTNSKWRIATWPQNGVLMKKDNIDVRQFTQEDIHSYSSDQANAYLVQKVIPFDNQSQNNILHSGASIQTSQEFGYGRWLARVKPSNVPGVLNSIFTKDWDDHLTSQPSDGTKREVDIEFLTYTFKEDSGQVHLAIHGSKADGGRIYAKDIQLNFNPSEKYHLWGFDILPDRVVWHVDGKLLHTWMYPSTFKVNENYEFFLNSWTKKRWINGPPSSVAEYEIDWVTFYPLVK